MSTGSIDAGKASFLSVTGATCLTSANSALIGILFQSTGTAALQLWQGVTATGAANQLSGIIRGYVTAAAATVNTALYYPFPAIALGGITVNVGGSADPALTLFWKPT